MTPSIPPKTHKLMEASIFRSLLHLKKFLQAPPETSVKALSVRQRMSQKLVRPGAPVCHPAVVVARPTLGPVVILQSNTDDKEQRRICKLESRDTCVQSVGNSLCNDATRNPSYKIVTRLFRMRIKLKAGHGISPCYMNVVALTFMQPQAPKTSR